MSIREFVSPKFRSFQGHSLPSGCRPPAGGLPPIAISEQTTWLCRSLCGFLGRLLSCSANGMEIESASGGSCLRPRCFLGVFELSAMRGKSSFSDCCHFFIILSSIILSGIANLIHDRGGV